MRKKQSTMQFPTKEQIEQRKKEYPPGTRVQLVSMEDIQAPPIGTRGTVKGVDDAGSLLMSWDNGSSLNVIFGEDCVEKIEEDPIEARLRYLLKFLGKECQDVCDKCIWTKECDEATKLCQLIQDGEGD